MDLHKGKVEKNVGTNAQVSLIFPASSSSAPNSPKDEV